MRARRFRFSLSGPAEADFAAILERSYELGGKTGRERYEALMLSVFRKIAADPFLPGSRPSDDVHPTLRRYHAAGAKRDAASHSARVRKPRHLIFYMVDEVAHRVIIHRILHDAMDIHRHLSSLAGEDSPSSQTDSS
jgi:toxin ParE1/3/4